MREITLTVRPDGSFTVVGKESLGLESGMTMTVPVAAGHIVRGSSVPGSEDQVAMAKGRYAGRSALPLCDAAALLLKFLRDGKT